MRSRWGAIAVAAALCVGVVIYRPEPFAGTLESKILSGYTATYRVTDTATADPTSHTERIEIRRPYGGRIETIRDGETVTGRITNRTFELQLTQGSDVQFAIRRQPGGPVRDVSFAAMRDAARAGVIDATGNGQLAGRRCRWFAFGAPPPEALGPPGRERVEACVDPYGIVLREIWTIGERVVRETELVGVEERVPSKRRFFEGIDPDDIDVTQPDAAEILRGQQTVSDDRGLPQPVLSLDAPLGRRDRVSGVVQASPLDGKPIQVSSTTFLTGDGVVVVERSVRAEPAPWAEEGETIDVGPGTARIVFYASHVEVRVRTNEAGFARISAPDRRTAEAFAEALTAPD